MDQQGISKLNLKRQNRMQVLNILKQQGPISRIDIASILKLTRAAVTIITNEMIDQGVLLEIGEMQYANEKVPKGRKKILIDINHNYKFAIGAIIDDNQVSIGLSTITGEVLDKRNMSFDSEIKSEEILDFIIRNFKELINNNCLINSNILGLGIGIVPEMHKVMGIQTNEKGEANYSQILKSLKMHTEIPILIDNSIKALALANIDFIKTKCPTQHNFVFIQYGENYNFINVNANEPQESNVNFTNSIDKMIVNPGGEAYKDYPLGSVHAELSSSALKNKIKRVYSKENTPNLYKLTDGDINKVSVELAEEAADNGDTMVSDVQFDSVRLLAILIHNLVCSANPQKVVLHNFFLTENEFNKFKKNLLRVSGYFVSDIVDMSIVEPKHNFLGGCALVTRELFFKMGGYDR